MTSKANLDKAKRTKQDEFYTPLSEIERELRHYDKTQFMGKTVLCNCDDPYKSNFFKYFAMNFRSLGLKRLVATHYVQRLQQTSLWDDRNEYGKIPHKAVYDGERTVVTELRGDGDFRSPECLELLDEADIVVTNPPFSLFREYLDTLIEHGKKFLIIGSKNAIAYKNVFPRLKSNEMGLGCENKDVWFRMPSGYDKTNTTTKKDNEGNIIQCVFACWFTNMERSKRHEKLITFRNYNPKDYPKYDNYNAIEVGKVADIPCDYDGVMGVPITYALCHNPEQFEILGVTESWDKGIEKLRTDPENRDKGLIKGQCKYSRIFIRRK